MGGDRGEERRNLAGCGGAEVRDLRICGFFNEQLCVCFGEMGWGGGGGGIQRTQIGLRRKGEERKGRGDYERERPGESWGGGKRRFDPDAAYL